MLKIRIVVALASSILACGNAGAQATLTAIEGSWTHLYGINQSSYLTYTFGPNGGLHFQKTSVWDGVAPKICEGTYRLDGQNLTMHFSACNTGPVPDKSSDPVQILIQENEIRLGGDIYYRRVR
jgi:hypothetical protein